MHSRFQVQQRTWIPSSENDCCRMCRSYLVLVGRQRSPEQVVIDFHNMRQLIDSAEDGCHLCSLILSEIAPDQQRKYLEELDRNGEDEPQIVATVWYAKFSDERDAPVPYLKLEEAHQKPGYLGRIQICELKCEILQNERHMNRLRTRVQPSTGSWETFNDIHYWLRECEKAHPRCAKRRGEQPRQMPTRLLEVGAFEPGPKVYHVTLLRFHRVQAFSEGVDIATLPKTFREAIGLTKALGLNYLWIGWLCIIQDSSDDWAYECTRMSSVYMGSFLNIGANAFADSRGGLFCQRSWKLVTPLTVGMTYMPIGWNRKLITLYPNGDGNILDYTPLGSRAWVAQERLLAPRTVHFLKHKVVWECDECFASESDVTGNLERKPFGSRTYLARPITTQDNSTYSNNQFLHTWADIVHFYSGGKLSVATDKLIATSGVARYMQTILWGNRPLQYYAGHWSHDFELQLVWYSSYFSDGSRLQTYIAPSWSWASYNGEVVFPRPYRRTLWAKLIHIDVHPVADSFGAVSSGFIRMRGPLCRAATTYSTQHADEEGSSKTLKLAGSGIEIQCVDLTFDDVSEEEIIENSAEEENHLVIFGVVQGEDTSDRPLEGIILRLTGHQRGQYQRIGAFRVDDLRPRSFDEYEMQERLLTIFGGDPEELEVDHCAALKSAFDAMDMPEGFFEQRGDDWYEFTIV